MKSALALFVWGYRRIDHFASKKENKALVEFLGHLLVILAVLSLCVLAQWHAVVPASARVLCIILLFVGGPLGVILVKERNVPALGGLRTNQKRR